MKIALHGTYSASMKELTDITQPNHLQYATRHGYTPVYNEVEYGDVNGLQPIRDLLEEFDIVLLHGMDTLFMNQRIRVEDVAFTNSLPDKIVMARETHGWWPINNDVMIFHANEISRKFCDRITADYEIWRKYQWLWQTHTWNLMQDEPEIAESIRLVHPRVMNATPFMGASSCWQLGDWIIHFMGMSMADKIRFARHYIQHAPNPIHLR